MADRADELAEFEAAAGAILARLQPGARSRLLRKLALQVRRSNQLRMAAQSGPDGEAWANRRPRKEAPVGSRPIRFLYRKGGGATRVASLKSWRLDGPLIVGFDAEAGDIRSFRRDRIERHLPFEGGSADPGGLPGTIRGKRGGVKRKAKAMFRRMRGAGFLKAGSDASSAWIEFVGRAGVIAGIHHYGLKDRISKRGPEVSYPQRRLLGFSQADREAALDMLLDELTL